jgi:hypothetical protein
MSAVTIALSASGGFTLTVPSTLEGRFHTIQVPGDESGIKVMRKVLAERQKASRREIGHDASPTQAMVMAWIKQDKAVRAEAKARAEEEKEEKRATEAKALIGDLDLGDLDL